MKFREAVSERVYELCDKYNYTPNRLAELSTVPPTTLRSLLANNVTNPLAEMSTVPPATFNDMINEKRDNPSSYVIYKICKTLKIEMKDFYDSDLFKNLDD